MKLETFPVKYFSYTLFLIRFKYTKTKYSMKYTTLYNVFNTFDYLFIKINPKYHEKILLISILYFNVFKVSGADKMF